MSKHALHKEVWENLTFLIVFKKFKTLYFSYGKKVNNYELSNASEFFNLNDFTR